MNNQDGQISVDCPPSTSESSFETQPSRLLQSLFENIQAEKPLVVLNIGAALPETINFFANYRCKLFITDLLAEFPLSAYSPRDESESRITLRDEIADILSIPDGVVFDIVFFWDSPNYLGEDNISALMQVLKPHLHGKSKAHCFVARSPETPEGQIIHGIQDAGHLTVRRRSRFPPNYQPLPQSRLLSLLKSFTLDRSVLMRDQRLELLLTVVKSDRRV
ncbi:MAG: hypothetical protein R3F41_02130 [Gammaproteobacteria bacterium]|nr:hypothetical protein [Pseudomonadales bacterium]